MKACLFSLVLALACVRPAVAADPEVAGGYTFLNNTNASQTFNGWAVSAGAGLDGAVGLVGEVGSSYTTANSLGIDVALTELSFMGGPKVVSHRASAVTPFVQFLAGGVRITGSAPTIIGTISLSQTNVAIQPGGGIDVRLSPRVGLRLQGDYRMLFVSGGTSPRVRVLVGMVVHGTRS
jgi:hypothetical protein